MTLRYILLICTSLGVFTVFALAREVGVQSSENPYAQHAHDEKVNTVEDHYFSERSSMGKSSAVTGDELDSLTAEEVQAPGPLAVIDPHVVAAQKSLRKELTDLKLVEAESNITHELYPDQPQTMQEAVIEEQEEEGLNIRPEFDARAWRENQQHFSVLFAP